MITYPIGKVEGYTREGFAKGKPVNLKVSVYFNEKNDTWLMSFGSPYDYDLAGLFKNALPKLIADETEDFCLDMGAKLFITNANMQKWMFKASAAAGAIDHGN